MSRLIVSSVPIGPFVFSFWPDGDDPGVGILRVETTLEEGDLLVIESKTGDVTRAQWDAFVAEAP